MDDKIFVKYGLLDGKVNVKSRYQWDHGVQLNVTGIPESKLAYIEFTNEHMTESIRPESTMDESGTLSSMIPDSLFMLPYPVICYVMITDFDSTVTTMSIVIPVIARAKPSNYICSEDEVVKFNDLLNKLNLSVQEVNDLKKAVEDAAGNAEDAAQSANNAASKIIGMTVSATTLPQGTDATVSKMEIDGKISLSFGIPRGDTGDTNGVLYGAVQTLTDAQKKTARNNIDSASVGDVDALKGDLEYLENRMIDVDGINRIDKWEFHSSISLVDGEIIINKSANKRICTYVSLKKDDMVYLADYTDARFYVYRNTDSGWVADNKGKWIISGEFIASATSRYLIVVDHLTTGILETISELSDLVVCYRNDNISNTVAEHTTSIENIDTKLDILTNAIPSYWQNEINDSISKIQNNNLLIGSNGVSFFFITDTHWKSNAKNSAKLLENLSKECMIPLVVFGGDAVKTYNLTKNGAINELTTFYKDFNKSFDLFATIGNHDNNKQSNSDSSTYLSDDEIYAIALRSTEKVAVNNPNLRCGYIDNVSQKVRFIQFEKMFPSVIEDGVLEWVDARITELPNGWTVVLFSHECFEGKNDDGTPKIVGGSSAQAQHFGSLECEATIACWICGHCHYDGSLVFKNMLIISTQSDNLTMSSMYGGAEMTLGTDTEQAFDCYQIDTRNRKIYITRIGAGDDREFTY